MLFHSYEFIFLFLPVSLIGYYFLAGRIGGKAAKLWLAGISFWLYGSFRIEYLFLLLASVLFNYGIARKIKGYGKDVKAKKWVLAAGVAGNLGLLVYFKYMNFFIENWNHISGRGLPLLQVALPVGISFFTFQQISYLVDCQRGEIGDYGFVDYLLYIVYFPKLMEGPLAFPSELFPQFAEVGGKRFDAEKFMRGICLFVMGSLKKVILADTFGTAVDYGYSNLELMHGWDALLLAVFYSLQLYFDFSGYCDMGRGISRMFGIELPVNFQSPYQARNIIDFWKQWHITLNRFFTKYIYIPLGGNRKGKAKTYRNLLFVFFVSGIWHGAGWNFILWGMLHGLLYVLTRMWQDRKKEAAERSLLRVKEQVDSEKNLWKRKIAGGVAGFLTFCYVTAAWVYFRAESVAQGNSLLGRIFTGGFVRVDRNLAGCFNLDEFWYILKVFRLDRWEFGHYILMWVLTVFALALVFFGKNAAEMAERIKPKAWTAVLFACLLLWCVLSFSDVSTFLYFNF